MAVEPMTDRNLMTEQKEDAGFNGTTSNCATHQLSHRRVSPSQFIMRASVAAGLLAFSWRLPDIWAATSQLIVRQTTPNLDTCNGYSASAIQTTSTGLTAQLQLVTGSCNVYGPDLQNLSLTVTYETG